MKTKYIYIAFLTILCGGSLVACSNGDEFFKDERYKKMIYATMSKYFTLNLN